jgi:glucose/arabinose dehydrogenase/PKD repeat protein
VRTARWLAVLAGALATCAIPSAATAQTKPPDSQFQKVAIDQTPGEPMDLAVLPDSRVLHTERSGEVWLHDPATGRKTLAAKLDVYQHDEEGLQSIAIDPDFAQNRWIYLYYSPPLDTPVDDPSTPTVNEGDAPEFGTPADFAPFKGHIQLSRFQWKGDSIDLGTEQKILQVPVDRGLCCHVGGDIAFDGNGNLLLSTGDDTNPFQSDGFTPIDERPDRNPAFDAQRTAANTNDLRGKVLRITPTAGGGYSVPEGNLFADADPLTRPEIYLMGLRNPFRIEFNRRTQELYVADYSPDAGAADPERGPAGHGKWSVVTEAANFGWPYCATAELPYNDYDFATEQSGPEFDCAKPVNESPHNTGARTLPPVTQPDVWYSYSASEAFPELETGGIGPMAGPAYRYDVKATRGKNPTAWPAYYDNVPLFYEWTRDYIKAFFTEGGDVTRIEDVVRSFRLTHPIDMEFGPNGSLYVLNYGDGFFGKNLPGAELVRIDYLGAAGNRTPTVDVQADKEEGPAPLTVQFTSTVADPEGRRLKYAWDFDNDGSVDSSAPNPLHTYAEDGVYRATLNVTDQAGRTVSDSVEITVGVRPTVELTVTTDANGFQFGDTVQYSVAVEDDDPVDCSRVSVTYVLGHDTHGHPQTTASGCSGTITTSVAGGHDPAEDDLNAVFDASYTDKGKGNLPPLTGTDQVVIEPVEP